MVKPPLFVLQKGLADMIKKEERALLLEKREKAAQKKANENRVLAPTINFNKPGGGFCFLIRYFSSNVYGNTISHQ